MLTRAAAFTTFLVVTALAALLPAANNKNLQPSSQPAFRSGVTIARVHASVVGEDGQPVRDLRPSDFLVEVGGQRRDVVFANFVGPSDAEASKPASGAGQIPSYTLNNTTDAGRVIVLVVDLISIRLGHEKAILETAARLVEGLGANDAVALIPVPGAVLDLTRDHSRVAAALKLLHGSTAFGFINHGFTVAEAIAFEQLDRRVIREVIERECCRSCVTCPMELRDETREFLRYARFHVQSVLTSMSGAATALRRIDAPKAMVLISAGLPFEQQTLSRFTEVQAALLRANVMMYSIQVSQPDTDAASMRRAGVGAYLLADITPGLANVATMAGGAFFRGVGTARGIFDLVRSEIVNGYTLGVEVPSTDPDKPLDVVVKVDRRGVTVRAPHKVLTPEGSSTPRTRLQHLLAQPVDVSELPLAVATFSARGEEPTTLKAIVAAEIARKTTAAAPIDYAWVVTRDGKPVHEGDGVATDLDDGARVVAAVQLTPGLYRLRFAAVDASGKGGTVEAALPVGLRSAADIQFSDLFVGVATTTFLPVMRAPRSTSALSAFVELYSSDPARFDAVAVELELRAASGAAVRTSRATMRATELERRQVAEGTFEISDLAPGNYTASAQISVGGTPVGRVSRAVSLEP